MSQLDLDPDVPTSTTFAGCVMQQLRGLKSNRYLSRPWRRPEALPFAPSWIHDDSLLTKREFGVLFRMTKESFDELLSLIDDHPVFSNNSSCPQKPPKYQLQVTLYHYEPQAHEWEQQFNLALEKGQFICMLVELLRQFLHYKESIYAGQNLTHWSMQRLLDDINSSMVSQTAWDSSMGPWSLSTKSQLHKGNATICAKVPMRLMQL